MPAPPEDARSRAARALEVRASGSDGVVLRIALDEPVAGLRAGRFFMLRRQDALSPAIPRPFSVFRERSDGSLEFLIKVMGRGTRALAACEPGTPLVAVGPLGLGWNSLEGDGDPWVMVAGGIGSVPFYMGIQQALVGMDGGRPVAAEDITLLYGAAGEGMLYELDAFAALGVRTLAATDDGSRGFHGNVVQLLEHEWGAGNIPERVRILCCGPDPMMRAVARVAAERSLECWLSLETVMGCGVGICNGCAVPTRPDGALGGWPVVKCCVEGPVFPADAILI